MVFTTHATLLGRYLAMNDPWFYDHLPFVDWAADAKRFNIEAPVKLERAAAHGAHVMTTVSQITASECEHLLGRKVDLTLPNGLNIERFVAMHEFQNMHREFKERIHHFVMGHFFSSYNFDLDRTLYFFTSGRYEYRNKGFDLTVEALAQLNYRLRATQSDRTVVVFFITKRPYRSISTPRPCAAGVCWRNCAPPAMPSPTRCASASSSRRPQARRRASMTWWMNTGSCACGARGRSGASGGTALDRVARPGRRYER
jgi:hypothetical protein